MRNKILVMGASGHAAVLAEIVTASGGLVCGFIADRPSSCGLRLLGDETSIGRLLAGDDALALAIAIGDNFQRKVVATRLKSQAHGRVFPALIHPSAVIAPGAEVGEGAVICAGAIVGVGAKVGAFAIVNTRASLDHHSTLGAFASLAPAAATGGNAHIGEGAVVGMGVMIHHGTKVGDWTVVGSSSLVNKDLPGGVVACGQPARVLRERKFDEPYL